MQNGSVGCPIAHSLSRHRNSAPLMMTMLAPGCYCAGASSVAGQPMSGWCVFCSARQSAARAMELGLRGSAALDSQLGLGAWSLSHLSLTLGHMGEQRAGTSAQHAQDREQLSQAERLRASSCPTPSTPSPCPMPSALCLGRILPPGTAKDGCWSVYRQGVLLGSGAFGTTYQATKRGDKSGAQYAIKMINKLKLTGPEEEEAVRREVQILSQLQGHPRVVRLYETYEDKHYVCLVMECCHGGDLHDAIAARGPVSEARAACIFQSILELVGHCHSLGIMHRDLKPDNFMLIDASPDSGIKAIDFGHSIHFKEGQRFHDTVGSVHYLAPELIAGSYGPEADLWACGIVLYCLLCGHPPFRGSSVQVVMEAIQSGDLRSKAWERLSAPAQDLIRGLLQPNPAQRATVQQALQHRWITAHRGDGLDPRLHDTDTSVCCTTLKV